MSVVWLVWILLFVSGGFSLVFWFILTGCFGIFVGGLLICVALGVAFAVLVVICTVALLSLGLLWFVGSCCLLWVCWLGF